MKKMKLMIKYLLLIMVIVSLLFVFLKEYKVTFYLLISVYIIDIICLMISIIKYYRSEKKIIDDIFINYYDIYKVLNKYYKDFKKGKDIDFEKLSDDINKNTVNIRDSLSNYDSFIGNNSVKSNIELGINSLDFSKETVSMLVDNDREALEEFFSKMIKIIKKLLIVIDEKKFNSMV